MADKVLLLKDLRVSDLKVELEKRGLATSGIKAILADRLHKHLAEEGQDSETFNFAAPGQKEAGESKAPTQEEPTSSEEDAKEDQSSAAEVPSSVEAPAEVPSSVEAPAKVPTPEEAPTKVEVAADNEETEVIAAVTEAEVQVKTPEVITTKAETTEEVTVPTVDTPEITAPEAEGVAPMEEVAPEEVAPIQEATPVKETPTLAEKVQAAVEPEVQDTEPATEEEAKSELEAPGHNKPELEIAAQDSDELMLEENPAQDNVEQEDSVEQEDCDEEVKDKVEVPGKPKGEAEEDSINLMLGEDEEDDMFKDEVKAPTVVEPKIDEAKEDEKVEEKAAEQPVANGNNKEEKVEMKDDDKNKEDEKNKAESRRNLWISGLASSTRATDLKSVFSKYGKVVGAKVVTNARTPGAKCYGYVTMGGSDEAAAAIKELHKTEMWGRIITVERAKVDSSTSKLEDKKSESSKSESVEKKSEHVQKLEVSKSEKEKSTEGDKRRDETRRKSASRTRDSSRRSSRGASRDRDRRPPPRRQSPVRRSARSPPRRSSPPRRPRHLSPISRREREHPSPDRSAAYTQRMEEERRHRQRERQRHEEEDRRRRDEDKLRRIEEEKIKQEREELRREREKLEREKQELLRFERERQHLERERLKREKDELERLRRQQALRLEEARRATKRPVDVRESSSYYDDRKRSVPDPRSALPTESSLMGNTVPSRSGSRNYESSAAHGYESSRSSSAMFTTRGDERSERPVVRSSYEKPVSDYPRSERDHRGHVSGSAPSSRSTAYSSRDPWAGSTGSSGAVPGRSSSGPGSGIGSSADWSRTGSGNVGSSGPTMPRPPVLSSGSGSGGRTGSMNGITNPFLNSGMGGGAAAYGTSGSYGAPGSDRYDAYKPSMQNSKHY